MKNEKRTISDVLKDESPIREYAGIFFSHLNVIKRIKNSSARLAMYDAYIEYCFYGIEPDFTYHYDAYTDGNVPEAVQESLRNDYENIQCVWETIKPAIDANLKRIRNGAKGGRPATNNTKTGGNKPT